MVKSKPHMSKNLYDEEIFRTLQLYMKILPDINTSKYVAKM